MTLPTPRTDPSVQAQVDAAATAYRGWDAARDKLLTDGPTPANIAAAKKYSANTEADQAVDSEAQQIKNNNSKAEHPSTIVSVKPNETRLSDTPPTISLTVCVDRRGRNVTRNGTPVAAATSFYIEHPTMQLRDGKWLVYSMTGEEAQECA